ncbi:MAG: TolC family protein [Bacteroidaceae bacterium]
MKKIVFLFAVLSCVNISAQHLSMQDAIDIALKKNFDIIVSRSQAEINKLNNTKGNAGMLPTVGLQATGDASYEDAYQKQSTGIVNKYSSQFNTDLSTNAILSWTLFDGGRMFITKNKLSEMQSLGEFQFRSRVMDVMYNVIAAYFDIVCQKEQLKSIFEVINYNRQREAIAQTGFNAGTLAKTELLQAQIDLNVAMETSINQRHAIDVARKELNILLGRNPDTAIEVSDTIPFASVPDKNTMMLKLESSNADLLTLKKQIDVAELSMKEAQKSSAPNLHFNGGYSFSMGAHTQGNLRNEHSNGIQVGATLSIPIYTAGETKRKVSVAQTELQIAQSNLDQTRLEVNKEVQNAYSDFESQQELLKIERKNNLLSKENLEISMQRLRLGQTTSLEVHQAQENYAQSSLRLINFEYNLKMAETKLRQMISDL